MRCKYYLLLTYLLTPDYRYILFADSWLIKNTAQIMHPKMQSNLVIYLLITVIVRCKGAIQIRTNKMLSLNGGNVTDVTTQFGFRKKYNNYTDRVASVTYI